MKICPLKSAPCLPQRFFILSVSDKIAKQATCSIVRRLGPKGDLLEHPLLPSHLTSSWIVSLLDEDGTEITVMILYGILVGREWSLLRRVMCTGSLLSCNGLEKIKRAKWECLGRGGQVTAGPHTRRQSRCNVLSDHADLAVSHTRSWICNWNTKLGGLMFGDVMQRPVWVGTQQHRALRADLTIVALSKGRSPDN